MLPLCSQFMYTLSLHIVNNKHLCETDIEIHDFNARHSTNLHPPISNLTKFQNVTIYCGIKIFNHLPANIKCLTNDLGHFLIALKSFSTPIRFRPWRNSLTMIDNNTCFVFVC